MHRPKLICICAAIIFTAVFVFAFSGAAGAAVAASIEDMEDMAAAANYWENLGIDYGNLGDNVKSKECHERALIIRLNFFGESHADTAVSLHNLGMSCNALGEYAEAKEYDELALAVRLRLFGENHASTANSLNNLGNNYHNLGEYAKAKELHERALAVRLKLFGENHADTAASLDNLANHYDGIGDYAKSKELNERALAVRLRLFGENHAGTAGSLNNLADDYYKLGDYVKSKELHERALAIYLKLYGEDGAYTVRSLNNLGGVYRELGDYAKFKELSGRVLSVHLKLFGEDNVDAAMYLNNLGIACGSLGDYAEAKEFHERALAIRLKFLGEEHVYTAASLHNVGNAYHNLGDHVRAAAFHERSIAVQRKLFGENHPDTALYLYSLSSVNVSLGNYGRAKELSERALEILLKALGDKHPQTAQAFAAMAEACAKTNLKASAVFYYKQAVNILQAARGNIADLDKELQKSYLHSIEYYYHNLAGLLVEQGRIAEAQQVLAMLKEEEFFDLIRRDQRDDPRSTAVSYSPREREQAACFRQIAEKLKDVNTALGRLSKDLYAFFERLEKNLKTEERTSGVGEEFEVGEEFFDDIQKNLKDMGNGAVLVHTLIAPEHVWLILTAPDSQFHVKKEVPQKELFEKIKDFRECLESPAQNPLPAAQALYDILIAPISEELVKLEAKTLMFYLDGPLRYIPMAALHDGERWLAEKYAAAVYTDAARETLRGASGTPARTWEAAALGVTKAHEGFSALPAVKDELESIVRLGKEDGRGVIPGVILMDEKFKETAFADALNKDVPVVHIASHFQLEPGNITNSYLLLGDGAHLTLNDFREESFRFEKVEHLTLSACNTAIELGEWAGREMEGLGVIAQKKGAKSVTATLWSIADRSTGIFMPRFYELLQREGVTKAEALRQAQLAFISEWQTQNPVLQTRAARGRSVSSIREMRGGATPAAHFPAYSHPYYWAPFILMGNWL